MSDLIVPEQPVVGAAGAHGTWRFKIVRDGVVVDEWTEDNIVVNEGLDYLLSSALGGGTPISLWYIGIFSGNYTPVATDTAATISLNSTEEQGYSETTRSQWVPGAVASQLISNSANMAQFTITVATTVYGAFLVSDSAKGGTAGTLLSAVRFATARTLAVNDILLVQYDISASSV